MVPVSQSIVGDGKDGRPFGDCLRACFASIFELSIDEVPHFADEGKNWLVEAERWLKPMGLCVAFRRFRDGPHSSPPWWPSGWWIASVESENFEGATHAVVMRGCWNDDRVDDWTAVAHDPSPHPRRTPYRFLGAHYFEALDPAVIAACAKTVRSLNEMESAGG